MALSGRLAPGGGLEGTIGFQPVSGRQASCLSSNLFRQAGSLPAESGKMPDLRFYTIAPPQLDPAPAVQPKQWLPVVISRLSILCGSTSHRKIGAPFSHCSP